MRLALFITRRYFVTRRSFNVINLITYIASLGVMVGTMALIVVLSVFNGFEQLIISLYGTFDADYQVKSVNAQSIQLTEAQEKRILRIPGVIALSPVIEQNVLVKYADRQYFATLKGIHPEYFRQLPMSKNLFDGQAHLGNDKMVYASVGRTIAGNLGLTLMDQFEPLLIYAANKEADPLALDQSGAFFVRPVKAGSVFSVQQDVDSKYILVPLTFVQDLLQSEKINYSSVEIICSEESKEDDIRAALAGIFRQPVAIKNKFEQHTLLYQIMRTEKWAVFFILLFILIVASFNIVGSLTMLLVEKQKDLAVMKSMGADTSLLKRIFITQGMQITLSGIIPGLLLGLLICVLQQQYGFISLGENGSFVVDAYPVQIQTADVFLTALAVLLVGWLASLYAVRGFSKMEENGLSRWLKGE